MDSLLEKLRAAAPQARDQRDRRRRARLKDRYQVRVASGQQIPEMTDVDVSLENGTANSETAQGDASENNGVLSEGEDVADRAASMLQGLRGDGADDGEGGPSAAAIRVRRRRDNAHDERRARRSRRGMANTDDSPEVDNGDSSTRLLAEEPIPELGPKDDALEVERDLVAVTQSATLNTPDSLSIPTTIISPPSPDGSGARREAP